MSDERINRILAKYPCDKNGIMTVGIDFLRHDLQKAFGKRQIRIRGCKPRQGQCCFEKADGDGGLLYCILDSGHKGKHEFYEKAGAGK